MAFPQVASTAFDADTGDTTTHDATIPSGTASGDLLIMLAGLYWPTDEPSVTGMPSGWTQLASDAETGKAKAEVWYKISDGTETDFTYGSDGVSTACKTRMLRITDWHGTTPPEEAGTNGPFDAQPDPPSLTPSWGAEDTLWIVFASVDSGRFTAWPTNYSDNQHEDDFGSTFAGVASATRELNAASEDPGEFTTDNNGGWGAQTIAVRPAGAAADTGEANAFNQGQLISVERGMVGI